MTRPSTALPSVILSFAIGAMMGGYLVKRNSSRTSSGDDAFMDTVAENETIKQEVQEKNSTSSTASPFQSPMSKARRSAPLHTIKKEKVSTSNTESESKTSAGSTSMPFVSPMSMARQDSPTTSSKPTPKVLLSEKDESITGTPVTEKVATTQEDGAQIRLVVQRFGQASLLIEPNKMVQVGESSQNHVGLLVYVSFAKTATPTKFLQAAKIVLNLPILTKGVWGDGKETQSILDMAVQQDQRVSIVLVPQANLISKVKSLGKSIQYHSQIDKEQGQVLYEQFVRYIQALSLQHQCSSRNEKVPGFCSELLQESSKPKASDASVPPSEMFTDPNKYNSWDDAGMPLTTANDQPLTKSALKKLRKQYETQKKRHKKYLQKSGTTEAESKATKQHDTVISWSMLDPDFIQVVAGTFGNLQALELKSEMGPFCHVMDL